MTDELKSCPFCGGSEDVRLKYRRQGGVHWVQCWNGECSARGSNSKTEAGAIAAWNTRTQPPVSNDAWQDISTAPRDGTAILVGGKNFVCKAYWSNNAHFAQFEEKPGWQVYDCEDGYYSFSLEPNEPTAWQPLPQPPKDGI